MSPHTPGPWSSDRNPIYSQWWISHDGGKPIATVKEEANGRLIAAAPDSLAANKHAAMAFRSLLLHDLSGSERSIINAALSVLDAAITKAEGTQS